MARKFDLLLTVETRFRTRFLLLHFPSLATRISPQKNAPAGVHQQYPDACKRRQSGEKRRCKDERTKGRCCDRRSATETSSGGFVVVAALLLSTPTTSRLGLRGQQQDTSRGGFGPALLSTPTSLLGQQRHGDDDGDDDGPCFLLRFVLCCRRLGRVGRHARYL